MRKTRGIRKKHSRGAKTARGSSFSRFWVKVQKKAQRARRIDSKTLQDFENICNIRQTSAKIGKHRPKKPIARCTYATPIGRRWKVQKQGKNGHLGARRPRHSAKTELKTGEKGPLGRPPPKTFRKNGAQKCKNRGKMATWTAAA